MQVQDLTKEVLAEMFGGEVQFAGVYRNGSLVGTYPELRKKVLDKEIKTKSRRTASTIMLDKLQKGLPDIEVFMNKSQPNISLSQAKLYVIAGTKNSHQMSITHKVLTYTQMRDQFSHEGKSGSHDKHILLSGLSFDDILKIVKLLEAVTV